MIYKFYVTGVNLHLIEIFVYKWTQITVFTLCLQLINFPNSLIYKIYLYETAFFFLNNCVYFLWTVLYLWTLLQVGMADNRDAWSVFAKTWMNRQDGGLAHKQRTN